MGGGRAEGRVGEGKKGKEWVLREGAGGNKRKGRRKCQMDI